MKKLVHVMLMAGCAGLIAGAAAAQTLGIGAGSQGSQNYAVNGALAKFFSDKTGADVRVQAFGGTGASMPLIDAGRLDIQAIVAPEVFAAVRGDKPFDGRAMKNLRAIANLGPSTYGFFVRKDSPYRTVADIKGLRITYGFTAQPTLAAQVDGILANGGLSITDMKPVLVPSVPRGVDDFIAGKADVAFFAFQAGKVKEADASVGIRWLALSAEPAAEKAMQAFVPGSYVAPEKGGQTGLERDTNMMAYDYILVAGAHVPDEVVGRLTRAIAEHPKDVAASNPTLAVFTREIMRKVPEGLPIHSGAAAVLRQLASN